MAAFDPALPYPSRRSPVCARNVVATSQPLAAQAGLAALARGGNAVDAALATAITLSVVEPTGNGLGSDAFALVWDGGRLHGLNASGRAPASWRRERFAGTEAMPVLGADAITVPGAVSAWVALSRRFGRLPFEDLFAAAIRYARDGYLVSPLVAGLWARAVPRLEGQPGFRAVFMPDGRAPEAGEPFRAPAMATTLEAIAHSQGEAFYRGKLAEATVDWVRRHGGGLAMSDLEAHAADWVTPLERAGFGVRLCEIPPNGQGIAAQMALGLLTHTDVAAHEADSVAALHLQIEATKLAFADLEAHVADRDHMRVPPDALLDDAYLGERAARIAPAEAGDPGAGTPKPGGTVYLAAADASGMMVSFIQSNYMGFGSGVVVPRPASRCRTAAPASPSRPAIPTRSGPASGPFTPSSRAFCATPPVSR